MDIIVKYVVESSRLLMPETWAAAAMFTLCYHCSAWLSQAFSSKYRGLTQDGKNEWDGRAVSMLNCVFVIPLALYNIRDPALASDTVWGSTYFANLNGAIACGYFAWDIFVSVKHYHLFGWGALVHAVFCFWVYSVGNVVSYHQNVMLLWELSTPFLNIRGHLSHTGEKVSILYKINGLAFTVVFIGVRIVWGLGKIYGALSDMLPVFMAGYGIGQSPVVITQLGAPTNCLIMSLAGTVLSCLNLMWASLMIKGLYKVIVGSDDGKKEEKKASATGKK